MFLTFSCENQTNSLPEKHKLMQGVCEQVFRIPATVNAWNGKGLSN